MKSISRTAFYTCGVRMQDAASDRSVCGDNYAESLMNEEGLQILETFKDEKSPNASTVARHRIIDDILRRQLISDPNLHIILLGAGFDSRAFRLKGGNWIELDEPPIIEHKNERLPAADCRNKLRRIAIDFSTESLAEKLTEFSSNNQVIVIVEGVFMYLNESQIKQMIDDLQRIFPEHELIGDLMSKSFFEEYGKTLHEKLNGLGASFKFTVDNPEELFLENGYCRTEKISVIEKAVGFGLVNIPEAALNTVLKILRDGNAIFVFANLRK